jgi:hypothetical protein
MSFGHNLKDSLAGRLSCSVLSGALARVGTKVGQHSTALLLGSTLLIRPCTLEVTMERYIHKQNLAHYRRLLSESEGDPVRNEVQHNWLIKLLANEEAEDAKPLDRHH